MLFEIWNSILRMYFKFVGLDPCNSTRQKQRISEDAIYQKQGTYQCQVREFGAVEEFLSNSIIITYRTVMNAVVSISISNSAKNVMAIDAIMGRVRDFIHQVHDAEKKTIP